MFDPFAPITLRVAQAVLTFLAAACAILVVAQLQGKSYGVADSIYGPFYFVLVVNLIFFLSLIAWIFRYFKTASHVVIQNAQYTLGLDVVVFILLLVAGIVATRGDFNRYYCASPYLKKYYDISGTCASAKAAIAMDFIAMIFFLPTVLHSYSDMKRKHRESSSSSSSSDDEAVTTPNVEDGVKTKDAEFTQVQGEVFAAPTPEQQQEWLQMQMQFQMQQQQMQMLQQQQQMQQAGYYGQVDPNAGVYTEAQATAIPVDQSAVPPQQQQ